jgi:3-hydroxyisobutyrate dehydrogenase-like beta-hydroxyacid dehydrogenase
VTDSESKPQAAADTAERIAFLGLGIMGSRMARNLRGAGFDVVVWNRTRARADELGEPIADSPRAAAEHADIVITMVVDAPQVEEVLFGENGAAEGLAEGALAVDMSTIAPSAVKAIASRLAERGIGFVDAPVTGSKPRAEDGTLTIMAGGSPEDFARARPLFEAMGELIVHCGPSGHGAMVKLLNNALAAINAAALAEAIDMAERYGLDTSRMIEVMSAGSAKSTMLDLKAKPMIERNYEPLFKLEHMLKDVRHGLAEAAALGEDFDLGADAEALYAAAAEAGFAEQDFAAVIEAVRQRDDAA